MKRLTGIKSLVRAFFIASFFLVSRLNGQTAVESWGQLRVEGADIVNEHGNKIQLQGMSLFWSQWQPAFYEYNTIKWLRDDWCANIIRPACGVEDNGNPYNGLEYQLAKARAVIDAAIELKIYVLVDWHAHYAPKNKEAAKSFFRTIAQEYGQYPNIIYETFNEPLGYDWNTIKAYHEEIIGEIRKYDPDNIIVCGTPQWSSYPDAAIGNSINKSNIAYTLHYYAASHFQDFRDRANAARNNGLCVFVTEYGLVNADGGGNVNEGSSQEWYNWMNSNKISHCNWSLGNKDEGASALKPGTAPGGFWNSNQLTWSGSIVRNNLKANCPDYPIIVAIVTNVPGKVEAEVYSKMLGIQKETTTDIGGGQNIGYTDAGDYLEYLIKASGTGKYTLDFRVAAKTASSFKVLLDGTEKFTVAINAGDWQQWGTISKTLDIAAGQHTVKLVAITGGWNLNYIDFKAQEITDCNGDKNGSALIDNCNICSGGNTGKAINACEGGCLSGYGKTGIKDDFTLKTDPFSAAGGVFSWGESKLAGDQNPNFQSILTRNSTSQQLDINITQGEGEYVPFGFSFGDSPIKTIDLTKNSSFEFTFKNPSTTDVSIAIAIQDINGNLINTYATASGKPFSEAWAHSISTSLAKGATITFKGDFKNGFNANYTTKSFVSTFDYSKVSNILITINNSKNTGSPSFKPLAISNVNLAIKDMRLGDCSNASNDNNKDCNGDLNGSATIDKCKTCSGGKTGIIPNNCDLVGVENTDNQLNKISIFPTPAQNYISIQAPFEIEKVELLDLFGKTILESTDAKIDVSSLSSGMYFVKIGNQIERFIKK